MYWDEVQQQDPTERPEDIRAMDGTWFITTHQCTTKAYFKSLRSKNNTTLEHNESGPPKYVVYLLCYTFYMSDLKMFK